MKPLIAEKEISEEDVEDDNDVFFRSQVGQVDLHNVFEFNSKIAREVDEYLLLGLFVY